MNGYQAQQWAKGRRWRTVKKKKRRKEKKKYTNKKGISIVKACIQCVLRYMYLHNITSDYIGYNTIICIL